MIDTSSSTLETSSTPLNMSPATENRSVYKPRLTPATMCSAASSSPSASSSAAASGGGGGSSSRSIRFPIPSPSRPRLDPRYASRLPTSLLVTPSSTETDLIAPPPTVYRSQTSIFRPTITTTTATTTSRIPPEHSHDTSFSSIASEDSWASTTCTPSRSGSIATKRSKPESGDRFIPNRITSRINWNLWENNTTATNTTTARNTSNSTAASSPSSSNVASAATNSNGGDSGADGGFMPTNFNTFAASSQRNLVSTLLRSELLGDDEQENHFSNSAPTALSFRSPRAILHRENVFHANYNIVNSFSLTPVGSATSQRIMSCPPKRKRRIAKVPFKVLDAPALQDDFYLNLVDWSSQNVLAVGLGTCVYLWSACNSKVTKLCDLTQSEDSITSVAWAQRGTHLSVGTNRGEVQLWDTIKCKKIRSMTGHTARVGTMAWTGPILASGSRDRLICLRDVRVQAPFTDKLANHRQEVCGLKWSFEEPAFLASGGNDNNLFVIDSRNPNDPMHKFTDHTAAVKAIAWSPHQHGLLASGGGTADRCIRFWNTLSGSQLNKIDTGSQVCNLAWSQNCNEIVSTHGYSLNQIIVWRYPSMSKVTTLTGHTYRVLYLAMSPDGSTVVTGAGDETLRFWQIFPGPRSDGRDSAGGLLFPNTPGSIIR